ncbi:MAG TPA: hypothetical protein VMY59_04720 [Candidatus Thermoplasmatota archaeon]|nr:hypothetical protein [Candidatus Thermoplasmatota archaeon]HUU87544.1 hypothetical protein [Candidatus Glassbacteria bacterium]
MKVEDKDIGRWCSVNFQDYGMVQGLITQTLDGDKYCRVFIPRLSRSEVIENNVQYIGEALITPEI